MDGAGAERERWGILANRHSCSSRRSNSVAPHFTRRWRTILAGCRSELRRGFIACFWHQNRDFRSELSGQSDSTRGIGATTAHKAVFAPGSARPRPAQTAILIFNGPRWRPALPGDRCLRIVGVASGALLGMLTLLGAAAAWADPAGTAGKPLPSAGAPQSAVLPSIEILSAQTNLAGTCGGQAFNINTYINVDSQSSAQVSLSTPGFPTLEQFTDETGSNIGPFSGTYPTFNIQAFGGGLAPNTPIRITINTYTGHALAGSLTYTTSMQYNCTSGAILNLTAAAPGDPAIVPTLGDFGLAATALLLALGGFFSLRKRAPAASANVR